MKKMDVGWFTPVEVSVVLPEL